MQAKANKLSNVITIVNNPCIEFWFLLHYEPTSRFFNSCGLAEKKLKTHLNGYEKSQKFFTKQNDDIYLKLKPYLADAIKHAEKLEKFKIEEYEVAICDMERFFCADEFKGHFVAKKHR